MEIVTLQAWEQILGRLEQKVAPLHFGTWLRPTSATLLQGSTLHVRVPNATFKEWICANCTGLISETIAELGLPLDTVVFSSEFGLDPEQTSASGIREQAQQAAEESGSPLNPSYQFSSFVVGSSNQFAQAAAWRVATDPGRSYNPLFLYGGVGLGKTHLMHAVGHTIRERHPHWRIMYLSAERFTNEMVESLKEGDMVGFHQRFRNVHVLLMDDVQFLAGKERIREEFFHTFNALHELQRQIVLTSDRPPKEIQVEERLRSRFASGLIADVQPPDLETRQAILMKLAESEDFALPDRLALFIATNVKSNIRELKSALVRLITFTSLSGEEPDEAIARQALKDLVDTDARRVSIELIQKTVCDFFGLRLQELKARDNSRRVVMPRQVAMWLARELTQSSLPEIARSFGDKHHTTVLHSLDKVQKRRISDKEFNKQINKLLSSLE